MFSTQACTWANHLDKARTSGIFESFGWFCFSCQKVLPDESLWKVEECYHGTKVISHENITLSSLSDQGCHISGIEAQMVREKTFFTVGDKSGKFYFF